MSMQYNWKERKKQLKAASLKSRTYAPEMILTQGKIPGRSNAYQN